MNNNRTGEFRFSPSLITLGIPYAILKYLTRDIPRTPLTPVELLRIDIGNLFEERYHLEHPEYDYQIPVTINPRDFGLTAPPMEGTLDFTKCVDGTLTVLDTKCVSSYQAKAIQNGDCYYYENQVLLYTYGRKKQLELTGVRVDDVVCKLVVLDRNYLGVPKEYIIEYNVDRVRECIEDYVTLVTAVAEGRAVELLSDALDYGLELHPWIWYDEVFKPFEKLKKNKKELKETLLCQARHWLHISSTTTCTKKHTS